MQDSSLIDQQLIFDLSILAILWITSALYGLVRSEDGVER